MDSQHVVAPHAGIGSHRHEVRDRLLRAALDIVNTQGIQNFTQARVASAAGVRQSHLTYYFPTRNDLLKAMVQEGTGEFLRRIGDEPSEEPRQLEWLRNAFAAQTSDCGMARLMVALTVASEEDASLKRWLEEMERNVSARMNAVFARFGVDASEQDLVLFHASCIGIAMIHLGCNTGESAERARRILLHAFDQLVASSRKAASARNGGSVAGPQPIKSQGTHGTY